MLLTHSTRLPTKVFELTIPDATTFSPDTTHEVGVNGVPPLIETLHETVESV